MPGPARTLRELWTGASRPCAWALLSRDNLPQESYYEWAGGGSFSQIFLQEKAAGGSFSSKPTAVQLENMNDAPFLFSTDTCCTYCDSPYLHP
jgi:hypothetical protein